MSGRGAGSLSLGLSLGCLAVLLLASCATVAIAQENKTTVCFTVYAPYIFLKPELNVSVSILDELYLTEMSATEFNGYFDGHDAQLVTALVTEYIEKHSTLPNETVFKLISSTANAGFNEALYMTRLGDCDLAIGAYVVETSRTYCDCPTASTPDVATVGNVCCLDFSEPYDRDGFAILTKKTVQNSSFMNNLMSQFNLGTLALVCYLVLALYASGHLIWAIERRSNSAMFPRGYIDGVDDGLWWSVTTMTTVGYGDKAPITMPGRFLGFLWMIIGLVIFGVFNGVLTSALTAASVVDLLPKSIYASQWQTIVDKTDLHPVCTAGDLWADELEFHGMDPDRINIVSKISECYSQLNETGPGLSKSVIYDRRALVTDSDETINESVYPGSGDPVLTTIPPGVVINAVLQITRYAIAFPKDSLYLEVVNNGLELLNDGTTIYNDVAEIYTGGWTLEECQKQFLGTTTDPFMPIDVEPAEMPDVAVSRAMEISVIAFTVVVSVIYLTVQIGGLWLRDRRAKKNKVHTMAEEEEKILARDSTGAATHAAVLQLQSDMADMRKVMQEILHTQRNLVSGGSRPGHLPPM